MYPVDEGASWPTEDQEAPARSYTLAELAKWNVDFLDPSMDLEFHRYDVTFTHQEQWYRFPLEAQAQTRGSDAYRLITQMLGTSEADVLVTIVERS